MAFKKIPKEILNDIAKLQSLSNEIYISSKIQNKNIDKKENKDLKKEKKRKEEKEKKDSQNEEKEKENNKENKDLENILEDLMKK